MSASSHNDSATRSPEPLLTAVVRALDAKKAEDLKVLDVSRQSSITDHLILATGTSDPHLRALRVELEKVFDSAGSPISGMETSPGSGWLVVDAFQIMVHIFDAEQRSNYRLEQLWKDAKVVSVESLLNPSAVQPKAKAKTATAKKAPAKKAAKKTTKKVSATETKKTAVKKVAAKKTTTKKAATKKTTAKKKSAE